MAPTLSNIHPTTLAALREMQTHHTAWELGNFGPQQPWTPLNGIWEEGGELARSYLKIAQGIRGDKTKHILDGVDAVGDVFVFLISYCTKVGIDIANLIEEAPPDAPIPAGWEAHDGIFLVERAIHRVIQAHMEAMAIEAVRERVHSLLLALDNFATHYLANNAVTCMFTAWDEVKRREWKVNPWNGEAETPPPAKATPFFRDECTFHYCPNPDLCGNACLHKAAPEEPPTKGIVLDPTLAN